MKKRIISLVLSVILLCGMFTQGVLVEAESNQDFGDIAYGHLIHLATHIGERFAGTHGEEDARDYIYQTFEELGYHTEIQPFSFNVRDDHVTSANVVAVKPGRLNKQIIIGAHYDTVRGVEGVDDNASGVAVMLEVAERVINLDTPYTIRFIAFGAEELGLIGSNAYVSEMSHSEINQTKAMINLDSLIAGDYMYVYGGLGDKGWVRELALDISAELGIDLQTNPGLNPSYPKGTTGNWSDHAPFNHAGIPFAYLESTNWEIGDLDGYTQTEKHGAIWHDPNKDNMDFIQTEFPDRMNRLKPYTHILTDLVLQLMPMDVPSISTMKKYVKHFEEEGDLRNHRVVRSLHIHLETVDHFQKQGEMTKAIKHMEGFQQLIEHWVNNGYMAEKAYVSLEAMTEYLLAKWEFLR